MNNVPHFDGGVNDGAGVAAVAADARHDPLGRDRKRWAAACASEGMNDLRVLHAVLDWAAAFIDQFLDDHPAGKMCGCDWCLFAPYVSEGAKRDLAGVAWQLETAAGMILSDLGNTIDQTSGTWAGDLRGIADVLDAFTAAQKADEPVTVG